MLVLGTGERSKKFSLILRISYDVVYHVPTLCRRVYSVLIWSVFRLVQGSDNGDYTESDDEGSDSYEPGGYHPVNIG